jgi:hypothetical protein
MSIAMLVALLVSSPAHAEPGVPGERATVTISPLALASPMVDLTGEYSLTPEDSVAVMGGLGAASNHLLYDVGGQYRRYVVGGFRNGIHVGGQARYTNAGFLGRDDPSFKVGPFLGAKLTLAAFSAEVQGGAQLVAGGGRIRMSPLLNLNMGVTF